jgi:DNA primase
MVRLLTKRIPDDFIEQLKIANPIHEVAGEMFELKQAASIYQAFCPNHQEKVPSLTFFDTNTFYCFSCGAGKRNTTGSSDVIAFITWTHNCSWMEAVNFLATRVGMVIPKQNLSPEDIEKQNLYEQHLENNRRYWSALQEHAEHKKYFNDRGFSEQDINDWRLGFVPHDDPTKVASRVVFPIMNDWGQTVGFSYRNMEDVFPSNREADKDSGPKYYNSPQSPIFNKGSILYGLHRIKKTIREKDYIVVGEGFGDTIMGQKAGLPFVSIMGTAFTAKHVEMIKRYTNNIVMWMDGDQGGNSAVLRMLDPLREAGVNVSIISTPGQDPDDVLPTLEDAHAWVQENKRLAGQFELDLILGKYRSRANELKFVVLDELRPIFARITNETEKEIYANQAAHDLGISIEYFMSHM